MITKIQSALKQAGVDIWRINKTQTESAELFFVGRSLDMRRMKQTEKYAVTLYRDFEKEGKAMRGHSSLTLTSAYTEEEIALAIADAFQAASFVANPTFALPDPVTDNMPVTPAPSPETAALTLAEALFDADKAEGAHVNSAEIFAIDKTEHILTSTGADITYTKHSYEGEFVVQCKTPIDVEMHHSFTYNAVEAEALGKKVSDALVRVKDRANAAPTLKAGAYTLILSENHVGTLLSYFAERSDASAVYSHYSTWGIGTKVQEGDGEPLELTLRATAPYSPSGIPMIDRPLVQKGELTLLHGAERFCSYLGIPMTGNYNAISCDNGSVSFTDMKKQPHLYVVSFSDFQMDAWTGHFGGEIRLAYYFDGKDTHIVTGGSVNGDFTECKNHMRFSFERYQTEEYQGPFAVSLPNVQVAGQ